MIKTKKGAPKKKAAAKAVKKGAPKKTPTPKKKIEKALTIAGQSYLPPEGGWKIDKKVPIPLKKPKQSLWPFAKMNIGDSFFVPNVKDFDRASNSIRNRGVYQKVKLTFRAENGGLRVWMVGKMK